MIFKVRKIKLSEVVGKWGILYSCGIRIDWFVFLEGILGIIVRIFIIFI